MKKITSRIAAVELSDRAMTWLFYTCLLALIPAICRLAVWLILDGGIAPIATIDIIIFGIVLHSANINEVNRISKANRAWQTMHNGTSTFFLMIYSLFLFAAISEGQNVNTKTLLIVSLTMGVVTVLLGISVIKRADAWEKEKTHD